LRVLVAPDSFKGSLDPTAVARALAEGWRRARPADEVRLMPLADGGEGTLEAIKASGTEWLELSAHARDPLGRPIGATFLRRDLAGIVELASASGLSRVAAGERDAMAASTLGTGQVLAAAVGLGVREVVLGLGGSATTDGGAGLLTALGARFVDERGVDLPGGGRALARLARVDLTDVAPILSEVRLTIASDVRNPLLGEHGAAATYGPQKGADEMQVGELDASLAHYADVLEAASGREVRDVPGAGAAGGTTAGLLAIADRFASFEIRPGVEVVMELTGFDDALAASDLVLTGEGRIDKQTGFGKTAMGVAQRARAAGVPCISFGGGATPEGIEALAAFGAVVVPVVERPMTVEEAMAAGAVPLARAAERAARLVGIEASSLGSAVS
jgi:glycerate kinase